jgi:hypothetical protein
VATFTALWKAAMPRPTFADPKTDFAFKRIFGSEEHKDVLVAALLRLQRRPNPLGSIAS